MDLLPFHWSSLGSCTEARSSLQLVKALEIHVKPNLLLWKQFLEDKEFQSCGVSSLLTAAAIDAFGWGAGVQPGAELQG